MKCKRQEVALQEDCDQNGDFRDGWQNCSVCGETDWGSLFKNRFTTMDVLDLITQSEKVMDRLGDIEAEHFERTYSEMDAVQLSTNTPFDLQEVEMQVASDEPFAGYLGDIDLLVENLIGCLNTTEKMELFITAHDEIFDTGWRNVYQTWKLERATKKYRKLMLEQAFQEGF